MSDEKGLAVLFIYQEDGTVSADPFYEDDGYESDPFHRAQAIWESCKDDFPGAIVSIGLNERARTLMGRARMRAWGFTEEELEEL